jgi:hypothetical protein
MKTDYKRKKGHPLARTIIKTGTLTDMWILSGALSIAACG